MVVNGEKEQIVKETFEAGNSVSLVARKYNIAAIQLFQWRRDMENGKESRMKKTWFRN